LLFVLLAGCFSKIDDKNIKAAREGIENRKIRKISDAELIALTYEQGRIISDTAQKTLAHHLSTAIADNGFEGGLQYCNANAYPLIDSMQYNFKVTIKRVSLKSRNPEDEPDALEEELLLAYQYNVDNKLDLMDNVQQIGKTQLLYTKPIVINNNFCLACHGSKDEISLENINVIKSLYPQDEAIDYKLGDLRGMWSIRFDKKELVKSFD